MVMTSEQSLDLAKGTSSGTEPHKKGSAAAKGLWVSNFIESIHGQGVWQNIIKLWFPNLLQNILTQRRLSSQGTIFPLGLPQRSWLYSKLPLKEELRCKRTSRVSLTQPWGLFDEHLSPKSGAGAQLTKKKIINAIVKKFPVGLRPCWENSQTLTFSTGGRPLGNHIAKIWPDPLALVGRPKN